MKINKILPLSPPIYSIILLLIFAFSVGTMRGQEPQNATTVITGIVKDNTGEPLPGVNVTQPGTTNGTSTDIDGKYTIKLAKGERTLQFSYIGFLDQKVTVGSNTAIDIVLMEDTQDLDEVVVIGYGTAKKRDLTGAVASIQTEALAAQAPRAVQDLMRGNTAGLNISTTNNAKGDADLLVRGATTLKAGSAPLLVVDGVIYEGALTDINPYDIERIDVLKDASSAAVYGAKAANGVIAIITRKGGRAGKPAINFNANLGLAQTTHMPKVLDGAGFIKFRQDYEEGRNSDDYLNQYKEMFVNPYELREVNQLQWYNYDQKTPVTSLDGITKEQMLTTWLSRLDFHTPEIENYLAGRETNWMNEVMQTGFQQDYTVSISNKTDNVQYYWSLGYADREGILSGDRYTNYRTHLNLESNITNFLSIGLNTNFSVRDEGYLPCEYYVIHVTPYGANLLGDPDAPEYNKRYPTDDQNVQNPFYDRAFKDVSKMYYNLNSSIYAIVKFPFNIEYQVNFTPHYQFYDYFYHESSKNIAWEATGGSSERTTQKTYNWQVDNVFRWKQEFNKVHSLEATFLINAEKGQYWSSTAKATKFSPNDILSYHRIQAGTVPYVESNDTYRTGDALMARLFYSFKNKYMITASVRRDGYSAFGLNNKRAVFPAVALGWTFSSEKFMEKFNDWFNYGKLRLSWGENGNRDIGQYEAISDMTSSLHPYISSTGTVYNTSQIYVNRMANSSLKWERTASFNVGLDFGILNDLFTGSLEGYLSTTNDLLVDRALPSITGFASVAANLGKLRNHGFEATINSKILKRDNLEWNAGLTYSMNRREIRELYGDMEDILDANGNVIGKKESDDPSNGWFIGQDPDRIWNYENIGVWQLGEETEASKYGCQPGDFKFKDQNNDGVLDNNDKIFQGYTTPRSRWTFHTDVTLFKNFNIATSLYANWGQYGTFDAAANKDNFPDRSSDYDIPRWTASNPINDYARIGSTWRLSGVHIYKEKSFVRMDNLTFSYNVPKDILKKFAVQNMRLSLSVRNVFIWSPTFNYWYDPEVGDYNPRTFNIGINFTL